MKDGDVNIRIKLTNDVNYRLEVYRLELKKKRVKRTKHDEILRLMEIGLNHELKKL